MAFDYRKLIKTTAEAVKIGSDLVKEAAKSETAQSIWKETKKYGAEAAEAIKKFTDDASEIIADTFAEESQTISGYITIEGAMKLMYLVMSADGKIEDDELTKFDEIGNEIDTLYSDNKKLILYSCKQMFRNTDEDDDYPAVLREAALYVINSSMNVVGAAYPVKLLIWNLLVIALSDNDYADSEQKIIKYIAKHMDLDNSIVPEMENAIRALLAIENEIQWLKTVNRPYLTVEAQINELSDRKLNIMHGVHVLIDE